MTLLNRQIMWLKTKSTDPNPIDPRIGNKSKVSSLSLFVAIMLK